MDLFENQPSNEQASGGQAVDESWNEMISFLFSALESGAVGDAMYKVEHDLVFDISTNIQSFRDMEAIREDFYNNGTNDVPYDRVLPLHGNKYGIISKQTSRPFKDITNTTGTGSAENSRTSIRSARKKRYSESEYCVFCYNNGAKPSEYNSHLCRDQNGLVCCPILQTIVCPYCKATGAKAHTRKYCPKKPIITPEDCEAMQRKYLQKLAGKENVAHCKDSGIVHACSGIVRDVQLKNVLNVKQVEKNTTVAVRM